MFRYSVFSYALQRKIFSLHLQAMCAAPAVHEGMKATPLLPS